MCMNFHMENVGGWTTTAESITNLTELQTIDGVNGNSEA